MKPSKAVSIALATAATITAAIAAAVIYVVCTTPRHSEPDTVSSDSADSFVKVQFSRVNRRLDEFRRELQKSRGESGEGPSGGSPFV